jgi:Uma2 family endonuclease
MDMESIFDTFKPGDPDMVDHHVVLEGISWDQLMSIVRQRDESGRKQPRVHYVDGVLELMMASMPHEYVKKTFARCVETWSVAVGIPLEGYGSFLIENKRSRRAAQADECYFVGVPGRRTKPDLAIEVVWTRGAIDKLEVYRKLGVREVWIWEDMRIDVFVFDSGEWHKRSRSALLPDADLRLFERCIATGSQIKALQILGRALKH